jgi:hypothetical protein
MGRAKRSMMREKKNWQLRRRVNDEVQKEVIRFRGKDNTGSVQISMAKELGTFRSQDRFPMLSFDGKNLFFVSSRCIGKLFFEIRLSLSEIKRRAITIGNGFGDIYWVDAKIIEDLKPKELK